jgi:hypothetical protein
MDLGSVSEKLRTDKYRFVEEALDDLQLIWDNCKSYNHPDTVSKVLFSGYTRQQKILKGSAKKWSKTTSLAYPSPYPEVLEGPLRTARTRTH